MQRFAMIKRYSVAEARDQLPAVLHEVEAGEPVEITRHGKPVAVVISFEAYARLGQRRADPWEAYLAWRQRNPGGVPDEVLDAMADPSRDLPPREPFSW